MTEINNTTISNIAGSQNRDSATKTTDDLGKDAFLKLMITQLQNQDPLSPAKNEDFIAQLAQFSSVEGIQNINNSIDDLASSFRSSQALEASTLVGRQVEVSSSQAQLTSSGSVKGTISLPSSADNVRLVIEDASGNTIRTIDLGSQQRGDLSFTWDGKNNSGEDMAEGQYTVKANGLLDGADQSLALAVGANVNSVTIGQDNAMILNIDGVGSVALADIKKFL